ncbi:hypothetical protein EDD11_000639 [Mortierella claussenii]|nr:hypothetical protein EDD11_000639 [Mortierella claussenii]
MAISRPELYNYLVDQVPAKKLLLDKKVQDVFQKGSVASCVCADGSSYSGIIIGADGAYSSVRLSLYRHLRNQGQLAPQDCQPMQYRYRALVGMTRTLDSDRFVLMKTQHSDVRFAVSNGSKSFTALPYGGQPFAQAGYDAVELANILYAHSRSLDQGYTTADSSSMDVAARLRSFEAERRSVARDAVKGSHYMGRLLSRQDWIGTTVRYILLNYVPRVILLAMVDRLIRRRPQAAFLPKII